METSLGGMGGLSRGPGRLAWNDSVGGGVGFHRESSSRATEQLSLTRLSCIDLGTQEEAKVQVCMPCA